MTTFPQSPRLLKGALVAIDPLRPLPTVIVFQYNPETLTRRIEAVSYTHLDVYKRQRLRRSRPRHEWRQRLHLRS